MLARQINVWYNHAKQRSGHEDFHKRALRATNYDRYSRARAANELAARQEISVKYAEAIVGALSRAGLLVSRRGKTGGYVLSKSADAITAGDILRAGEGSLATVACLSAPVNPCPRAAGCKTLPFWRALDRHIAGFCDSVSLSALVTGEFLP